jgi:hypothetical protein
MNIKPLVVRDEIVQHVELARVLNKWGKEISRGVNAVSSTIAATTVINNYSGSSSSSVSKVRRGIQAVLSGQDVWVDFNPTLSGVSTELTVICEFFDTNETESGSLVVKLADITLAGFWVRGTEIGQDGFFKYIAAGN